MSSAVGHPSTRCLGTSSIVTRSSAATEIVRDADDVDFSVDDVHCALTLAFNSSRQTVMTNRETAIQGHSRSSVVVPIDAAYMTSY